MVCDCEYAEKNNGMDRDTQACVAEKLTLDHSLSLVNEAETLATKDTSMITRDHQGLRRINSTTRFVWILCSWLQVPSNGRILRQRSRGARGKNEEG